MVDEYLEGILKRSAERRADPAPQPATSTAEVERSILAGGIVSRLLDAIGGSPTRAFGEAPIIALGPEFAIEAAVGLSALVAAFSAALEDKKRAVDALAVAIEALEAGAARDGRPVHAQLLAEAARVARAALTKERSE